MKTIPRPLNYLLTLVGDCDDEDADGSPNEGAGVPHGQQAFALDELRHLTREFGDVRLHVVLQDKPRQGPGWKQVEITINTVT